jgi:hypothetical protein
MSRCAALLVLFVVGCGDAGGTGSDHWTGVSGNGGDDTTSSGSDASSSTPDASVVLEAGPQTQEFQLATDKTSYSVELRSTVTVQVTVTPQGFAGTVNLAVTGLPTDASGAFSPASLALGGTAAMTSTLTITTLSTVLPATTPFMVTATAGSATSTSIPMLDVMPQITIQIPNNVESLAGTTSMPSTNAFGDYPIVINAPSDFGTANTINVKFLNLDATPHCIHATNPSQGFPHDATTNGVCNPYMDQNQYDTTAHNVNTKGSYLFYLHDEGDTTQGMVKIQ